MKIKNGLIAFKMKSISQEDKIITKGIGIFAKIIAKKILKDNFSGDIVPGNYDSI